MPHRLAPTVRIAALPTAAVLVLAALLYIATNTLVSREFNAQNALRTERRDALLSDRFGGAVSARAREVEQLARFASVSLDDVQALKRELEWLKARVPAYAWIGFAGPDGIVKAGTGGWLEGTSISTRPVFVNGSQRLTVSDFHAAVALSPYLKSTDDSVADVGAPVYGAHGEFRGVVAAHTLAKWYVDLGERTVTDEETDKLGLNWFLIRGDGTSLSGTLPFDLPDVRGNGAFTVRGRDGRQYAGSVREIRTADGLVDALAWRALVVSRVDIANAPLEQFNHTFAIFVVVSTFVCIAVGLLASRLAGRPYDRFFSVVRKRFEAAGGPGAMPYNSFLGVLEEELASDVPNMEGVDGDILLRLARDAQQLRRAFDHLPVAVAISTRDFRVQYVNETYTRMLGWTTAAVAGMRTAEFLFQDDEREPFQEQLRQLGDPPGELAARFNAVRADGSRLFVQWELSPVLDRAGTCIGIIVMIQDISGEVAAQQRALALSDRLRIFADSALDYALVMLDGTGRVTTWSRGASVLLALDAASGGSTFESLVDDSDRLAGLALETARTTGQADIALSFLRPGRESFFAEGTLYRLSSAADTSFALIVRDTTVQREAQRRLTESQARLAAVIASASDAVVVCDLQGRVTLFNPSAERIFGRPSTSIVGQSLDRLLPDEARPDHAKNLQQFARSGVSRRRMGPGKVFGLNANGERIELEASISQAEVGGQTVMMAILRDVTDRSKAEKALVQYQLQLAGLTQQLLAQEKNTTRLLAQSLHDELGQTLSAMRLIFDAGMLKQPSEGASPWLSRLNELIAASNRQVRRVLTDLRPPLLDELGLIAALDNELSQRRSLHSDVCIALDADAPAAVRWPVDVEYSAFMVAREAVNNALAHSEAANLSVHISGLRHKLVLSVSDDGTGMENGDATMSLARPGHLGLVGMRERAFAIGASLDIATAPGQGTTVMLRWEGSDESALPG